jgi:hypothetical protein
MASQELPTIEDSTDNGADVKSAEEKWRDVSVIDNTGNATVREFDAASDDHPLVQYMGSKHLKTDIQGGGEFVSEEIYEGDYAFVREWLQNQETACIRRCKMIVELSDEHPDGWLTMTMWVDSNTGDTVLGPDENQAVLAEYDDVSAADIRKTEIPRPIDDVMEAAKSLGYDPTIEWDVYLDERKIVTEDNGIGMTPEEFVEGFKSPFSSGSGVDGETGGNFGIGSNSVEKVHGAEGSVCVTTLSARPGDWEGFTGYSYRGGVTAVDGEKREEPGTFFEIPVCDDFDLDNLQEQIETYTEMLRVPVKYAEHNAGVQPVDEEYESTRFIDEHDNPPIVIDRPGEFTLVAGPDVYDDSFRSDDDNTYLVSMPIDRNTSARISTFWNIVIQIHDEQGRIVSGPNRGRYHNNGSVYLTGENIEKVDDFQPDDVALPVPTGDRDRLASNSESKEFFYYIQDVVKEREISKAAKIAKRMKHADHAADVIKGNSGKWRLFTKMIDYHGSRRVTDCKQNFRDFIKDQDTFPDFSREKIDEMYELFRSIEVCHKGPRRSNKKSERRQATLGDLFAKADPDTVYMAASTGGKFTERFRVADKTHEEYAVVVVDGARRYDEYGEAFGFEVLKDVPLTRDEDHDYDIPNQIHKRNSQKRQSSTSNEKLKLRTGYDSSAIDLRLSIDRVQDLLESGGGFDGHSKLVLFPRGGDRENISDHYDVADHAAIASVSVSEYEQLADYDNVMTFDEFEEWSRTALIATEDGAMTPEELVNDDRMVVLAYRTCPEGGTVVKLLSDRHERLREFYAEDVRDQLDWAARLDGYDGGYGGDDVGNVPDDEKDDTLFAVACETVLNRAEWAFSELRFNSRDVLGLKLEGGTYGYKTPCEWISLDGDKETYQLKVDTPKWDNDSEVYDIFPRSRQSTTGQVYLGLHDRGIDPTEVDDVRDEIAQD